MSFARSVWRKSFATVVTAIAFVTLYEVTMLDSNHGALVSEATALPAPGARLDFSATAYCKGATTASGVVPRTGVAAADPELLPVGSVVEVDASATRYSGIYTIMDTGPKMQGRQVDIYMWSCNEALQFGRRAIRLGVLRLGWNPLASAPNFVSRIFKSPRPSEPPPLPSHPILPPLHLVP